MNEEFVAQMIEGIAKICEEREQNYFEMDREQQELLLFVFMEGTKFSFEKE